MGPCQGPATQHSDPANPAITSSSQERTGMRNETRDVAPGGDVDLPNHHGGSKQPSTIFNVFRGVSSFNGDPVVGHLFTVATRSRNRKVGNMAQLAVFVDGISMENAYKSGADEAVCGDCPLRPRNLNVCYAVQGPYLGNVERKGRHLTPDLDRACGALKRRQKPLRLGAYGDAACLPFLVVKRLVDAAGPAGQTMFTRGWRTCDPHFQSLAMASVFSLAEQAEARSLGWRTFRVRLPGDPLHQGEISCPAVSPGSAVQCAQCLLCSGISGRGGMIGKDRAVRGRCISVEVHGTPDRVRRFVNGVGGRSS